MRLSEDLLTQICKKSLENARDLISDADLLSVNLRIPRAYTLFQLAIEELGKAIYCFIVIFEEKYDDPETLTDFKKVFFSHQRKTDKSNILNFVIAQVLFKGNFIGALNFLERSSEERNKLKEIDNYKNYSLYTSVIDSQAKNPVEIISKDDLSKIEQKARARFGAINALVTLGIDHLPALRDKQKANPNYKLDNEEFAREFWQGLM